MYDFRVTYKTVDDPRSNQTGAHLFTAEAEAKKFMKRLSWWRQARLQDLRRHGGRR